MPLWCANACCLLSKLYTYSQHNENSNAALVALKRIQKIKKTMMYYPHLKCLIFLHRTAVNTSAQPEKVTEGKWMIILSTLFSF